MLNGPRTNMNLRPRGYSFLKGVNPAIGFQIAAIVRQAEEGKDPVKWSDH